jgi:aldose 1-epimerase
LEEQRIGMMYLNLFKRWLSGLWDRLFPRGIRRSSALPVIVIALVILLPVVGLKLHYLGRFGALKREIKGEQQGPPPAGPRPGGMDPIFLKRNETAGSNSPEFRSITILPGLGMQLLQITAFLPSKGEIDLMAAPTVKELADGPAPTRSGPNDRWGAIEAPWSGLLTGVLSPLGTSFRTTWRGRQIEAPTDVAGHGSADGGLMPLLAPDTVQTSPDGTPTAVSATFKGTDFDDHWASRNDVTVDVKMGATTIDLTVTAKNVGDSPEPMGLGWHPRFVIPSGNRDAAEIHLPIGEVLEIADKAKGIPSGKMASAGPAFGRFQAHPAPIGAEAFDAALVHLKPGMMDSGSAAELRDPASEFGLRMTAVSSSIRELRVTTPSGADYVSLGMQTNYDDPLGKEWTGSETPSIDALLPGQAVEWKIRLEIFPISSHSGSH